MFSINKADCVVERFNGIPIVVISGDFTSDAEELVLGVFSGLYNEDGSVIGIEFSRSEYINSSGLAVILKILKESRSRGKHVVFVSLSEYYQTVFSVMGLLSSLRSVASREEIAGGV